MQRHEPVAQDEAPPGSILPSAASCRSPAPRPSCCSTAARQRDPHPSLAERPGDGHAVRHRHDQYRRAGHRLGAERAGAGAARGRERAVDRRARPRRRAVEGRRRPGARPSIAASRSIPALGDRVRVASRPELELAFCGDKAQLGARRLHPPGPARSRPWSASTICSASISPSSAPPAPASPARRR